MTDDTVHFLYVHSLFLARARRVLQVPRHHAALPSFPRRPVALRGRDRNATAFVSRGPHQNSGGHGSKPMVAYWDRCTTHFRTYFSGDWDVHWGILAFDPWPTDSQSHCHWSGTAEFFTSFGVQRALRSQAPSETALLMCVVLVSETTSRWQQTLFKECFRNWHLNS